MEDHLMEDLSCALILMLLNIIMGIVESPNNLYVYCFVLQAICVFSLYGVFWVSPKANDWIIIGLHTMLYRLKLHSIYKLICIESILADCLHLEYRRLCLQFVYAQNVSMVCLKQF